MGRTTRTVTPQQWRALVVRDIGCAFYGCDRPAAHCEAHHLTFWSDGGPTDIENLALFCDYHHHVIHKPGWKAEIGTDGRPVVIPAPWVDSDQNPEPTGTGAPNPTSPPTTHPKPPTHEHGRTLPTSPSDREAGKS